MSIPRPTASTTIAWITAAGTAAAAWMGVIGNLKDTVGLGGQASAQIDTIDQRLKLVEDVIPQVEAIKKTAEAVAETMRQRIFDAQRAGEDVKDLKARQRELELRVERLNTLLDTMRRVQ